jgi:23S rRNA (cytosine1962-C5)-methyltransferase
MIDFHDSLSHLPHPSDQRIALRVTPAAERALRKGHPWVFDQSIIQQRRDGSPGDLAVIFDSKRRFLAVGLYDPTSPIRARILQHHQPADINDEWFLKKLTAAVRVRAPLLTQPEDRAVSGCRLVHGENDGLPGLVIDRYAGTLVLKLYTPAWVPHLNTLCSALEKVFPAERLILRLSRILEKQPATLHGLTNGMILSGSPLEGSILFQENGLTFEVDPVHGQKTGFFLDQRDNRARVEHLSQGKSVLNIFAYSGAFSVYAARGGAQQIVSVDTNAAALEAAARNMAHNRHIPAVAAASHETLNRDAFQSLAEMRDNQPLFDLVIIDPPMFAHSQGQISAALSAYKRLTRLGLGVLRPGGMLVQASCSSRVTATDFFGSIHQAAQEINRPLQEIERSGHALDHPITFNEGAYLKCLFAAAD